ncbi:carbamoyltransferase HypF [Gemmiger formicilis]|uniref:carbamoyltransferase HypF n=1 Tax=Gemmiger formicilis TaxID=745368 RepID=UPI001958EEF0|nr:carbamoyltransferase HypF [Gemmiger formicilis]MBM6717632.1 carbamoyltransferase HypF [Gemmiger formicilis]
MTRLHFLIEGIVQGVGFRPFVHRQAARLGLSGWARNTAAGLELELEGPKAALDDFQSILRTAPPPLAVIEKVQVQPVPPTGERGFSILPSREGAAATLVSPDLAPCPACLAEMNDPQGRRYRYPFINCTDCGPRFSIIRRLPYDRPATTMAGFAMCPDCEAEYTDITSRRYHAQPNCCPVCGPRAIYLDAEGHPLPGDPIALAQQALAAGQIVAVKGTGGIHLACRADDPNAVARLRRRKHRPEKPLALMARDLEAAGRFCRLSEAEAALLQSPRRPILLLSKRDPAGQGWLSATTRLGVMLPYTPLHILLLDGQAGGPDLAVMTSANRPCCPVLIDNEEALAVLHGVADGFLLHDRPIANRCDDSLAMVWRGAPVFFRHSRGYAPQPLLLDRDATGVLALGAEQKGSFAAGRGRHAFVSQYIGDLKNAETLDHYRTALHSTLDLFGLVPQALVCDLHPDYASTRLAEELARQRGLPLRQVQHHWAHMAACMADNRLTGPVFGLVWDGTGLGEDGTIWGGECLIGDFRSYRRVGSLRPVALPGGDVCAVQIGRTALALATDAGCADLAPDFPRREGVAALLNSGYRCPRSSGMGRLFDGVYALLTGRISAGYDGQAPALLEALAEGAAPAALYTPAFYEDAGVRFFDTRPLIRALCTGKAAGTDPAALAAGFQQALCAMALDQCRALNPDKLPVVLSGGVFLNRALLDGVTARLEGAGYRVYTHKRVSPSDEGLALGQLAIGAAGLDS